MSDAVVFVARALDRCRRVVAGVDELMPLFGAAMPFRGDDLATLSVIQRTAATAFLKRFEQLQDLVGRATRAIAGWEGADGSAMSQRDLGDWLEKRAIIDAAEEWMVLVRLRNRLAHEYPIEEAEQVSRLNEAWSLMPVLRAATTALTHFADQKGLFA